MKALVIDHSARAHLVWGEAPAPVPLPDELLVRVEAVSVNPGELAGRVPNADDGDVLGWEAAGVVVQAAANGSGPAVGERVTTFGEGGGWAELRAVPVAQAGVVPDPLDAGVAAALPVAGASALRAVRSLGSIVGRTVLVTGANGSVGRIVVQLAARGGAQVVAVARDAATHDDLRARGARVVVADPGDAPEIDHVIDTVGGPVLVAAFRRMRSSGVLVPLGHSSHEDSVLTAADLTADHGSSGRSIRTFFMPEEPGDLPSDLSLLGDLALAGAIDLGVDESVPISQLPERLTRAVRGKLVATV